MLILATVGKGVSAMRQALLMGALRKTHARMDEKSVLVRAACQHPQYEAEPSNATGGKTKRHGIGKPRGKESSTSSRKIPTTHPMTDLALISPEPGPVCGDVL